MDKIESEIQVSAAELLTLLRQGGGVSSASSERLKNALRSAAEAWARSETIAKSAANLFVDLASGIEACSYAYTGDESEQIRILADEVAGLVRACVALR